MKNIFRQSGIVVLILSVSVIHSCKKDKYTLPVLTTSAVTAITQTTATSGGTITADGGALVTSRGVCWNTGGNPTISDNKTNDGSGLGSFVSNLTGLSPNTHYYLRAFATNSAGTGYSIQSSFTTQQASTAALTTADIFSITTTSFSSGGIITNDNGSPVTERGICWNTTGSPTISDSKSNNGSGTGDFTSNVSGLQPGTLYYLRSYATNSIGTEYGNTLYCKTYSDTVNDIDGNTYYTTVIGGQEWMAANLKVTKYQNGDPIPNITDYTKWDTLTQGARSTNIWVNNYVSTYGWYYNWRAVTDSRRLCPSGWHVPSDAEWTTLTTFLGGENVAGGKLKESGVLHWVDPNTGSTNETGFTALPGEFYLTAGGWVGPGYDGVWWSSTESDATNGWNRFMFNNDATVSRTDNNKRSGFSVRCLKD